MDHAIDSSLLGASSPPADTNEVPPEEIARALDWLDGFRGENGRKLALDQGFALWGHYLVVGEASHGLLVLQDKLDRDSYRLVPVRESVGGEPMVADEWMYLDPHRKRLLAVAQHRPAEISVVNGTHEAWHASRLPANVGELRIDHVLENWLNARFPAAPPPTQGAYHAPPEQLEGVLAAAVRVGAGSNNRMAWEDNSRRYEFDRQHNTVEVYALGTGVWIHEARLDGTILNTTGGEGRSWGKS